MHIRKLHVIVLKNSPTFLQVKGGSGRNGGAGGRFGIEYGYINFIGEYYSDGGEGNGGESAAAGTVFTKDTGVNGTKTLKIYNREGEGVSLVILQYNAL